MQELMDYYNARDRLLDKFEFHDLRLKSEVKELIVHDGTFYYWTFENNFIKLGFNPSDALNGKQESVYELIYGMDYCLVIIQEPFDRKLLILDREKEIKRIDN